MIFSSSFPCRQFQREITWVSSRIDEFWSCMPLSLNAGAPVSSSQEAAQLVEICPHTEPVVPGAAICSGAVYAGKNTIIRDWRELPIALPEPPGNSSGRKCGTQSGITMAGGVPLFPLHATADLAAERVGRDEIAVRLLFFVTLIPLQEKQAVP